MPASADQMARTLALEDQIWMNAEEYFADFDRLQRTGMPATETDVLIVRMAMCIVAGGIQRRREQRGLDAENPTP